MRETTKVKQRRTRFKMYYDVVKAIQGGSITKSKIYYSNRFSYPLLTPLLKTLTGMGLIVSRDASEVEYRRDKRSKWYLTLTEKGLGFLREVEALDKRYDGILLGE